MARTNVDIIGKTLNRLEALGMPKKALAPARRWYENAAKEEANKQAEQANAEAAEARRVADEANDKAKTADAKAKKLNRKDVTVDVPTAGAEAHGLEPE